MKQLLIALIRLFLFFYYKSLRIEIRGQKNIEKALTDGEKLIFALWHSKLLFLPLLMNLKTTRNFKIAISKSRDGDLPTALANSYSRFGVIRVPHNARHAALLQLIQELKKGASIVLTPDGPRGPAEKIKPGIYKLQEATNATVVSFTWRATRSLHLRSWDRFEIPLPFTKVLVEFHLGAFSADSLSASDSPSAVE